MSGEHYMKQNTNVNLNMQNLWAINGNINSSTYRKDNEKAFSLAHRQVNFTAKERKVLVRHSLIKNETLKQNGSRS